MWAVRWDQTSPRRGSFCLGESFALSTKLVEKEWQTPDVSHMVDEMLNHEVGSVSVWLALPFKGTKSTETFFYFCSKDNRI